MNKAKIDRLIQEYSEWNHKQGLGFGFDDEALTHAQRQWLADFCIRWERAMAGPARFTDFDDFCHRWNRAMGALSSPR
jgi:hypothetical protein